MIKRKRKETEQYGLSFLDCICCGFGAVLLLFVLTSGKRANVSKGQVTNVQEIVQRLQSSIEAERQRADEIRSSIEQRTDEIGNVVQQKESLERQVVSREEQLSLLLDEVSNIEDELRKRMEDAEALPTVDEMPPLPLPNPQRRQFLTNFRLEGERLLILVEASGGMLDMTIDGAVDWSRRPVEERRQAPKWKQTMDMVRWFLANISPSSRYQVAFFNDRTRPLLAGARMEDWLDPLNTTATERMMDAINDYVPSGPANLERAFQTINGMELLPDNIILIMDGLPTGADSVGAGQVVDENTRIQMFLAALRVKPPNVPFNILLLPFEGDPHAAIFFWSLANYSQGTMITPHREWPNI